MQLHMNQNRRPWYRDKDGVWSIVKDSDDSRQYEIDFAGILHPAGAAGRLDLAYCIATATATSSGVTISDVTPVLGRGGYEHPVLSEYNRYTAVRFVASGSSGTATFTLTTTGDVGENIAVQTITQRVRFVRAPMPSHTSDY